MSKFPGASYRKAGAGAFASDGTELLSQHLVARPPRALAVCPEAGREVESQGSEPTDLIWPCHPTHNLALG